MASVQSFARGNITLVDDRLIQGGVIALFTAAALCFSFYNTYQSFTRLQLLWVIGIAVVSIFLIVAGIITRKREKKCIGLWRLLQSHPEIQLSLYLQQSGNTLADVERAVKAINSAGAGLLIVDTSNDRLYDSRLNHTETITFQCTSCGASSTASVGSIDGSTIVCQYCEAPAPDGAIPNMNSKHQSLVKSNTEIMGLLSQVNHDSGSHEDTSVNVRLFFVLLVMFWPGALTYVVWKKRATLQQSLKPFLERHG